MRREVVVVLPYAGGRVLMHLRDRNAKYNPEMWGFFSGGVEPGETPMECALREIEEEINLKPAAIHKLDSRQSEDLTHVVSHAFYCALDVPLDSLILREGLDSGLFTVEEIGRASCRERV